MIDEIRSYTLTSLTRLEAEKTFKSRNRIEKIRDMMFGFSYKNRIYTNKSINFNSKGEFILPDKKIVFDNLKTLKLEEEVKKLCGEPFKNKIVTSINSIKPNYTNTVNKYIEDYKRNKLKVLWNKKKTVIKVYKSKGYKIIL